MRRDGGRVSCSALAGLSALGAAALIAAGAAVIPSVADAAAVVAVDGGVRHQRMDGFGSSVRVFDDPHLFNNFNPATGRAATVMTTAQQDEVLDRLYIDLGLTRVRPASPDAAVGAGIEPVNDNSDPYVTDASKFNFAWKNLDAHVDYIARARQRGADTFFLSPLSRESWMGTTTANDVAEYSEWLLAQVRRAADRGVRLPYLSVANEPSASLNSMSPTFTRDVIKNLGPRLRAEGLSTMFVTPDDERPSSAATQAKVILADPVARQYVGALATHLYGDPVSRVAEVQALAKQYQLPLWMTEFYQGDGFAWASLMHDLISTYDVSAVDYLWGFFGQWQGSAPTLISLNNNGSAYLGYTLTKTYYTMGQFSRFIKPGAQRINAESNNASVQTTAFLNEGELVIVAINTGSLNEDVTFDLSGLPDIASFDSVRTSGSENWTTLAPLLVNGSTFTATLAHGSVTTFTANVPEPRPLWLLGSLVPLLGRRRSARQLGKGTNGGERTITDDVHCRDAPFRGLPSWAARGSRSCV
jgi:O-glycosyl hydrolase